MILERAPLPAETRRLIAAGVTEIEFPHVDEDFATYYAAELAQSRDMLIVAGVRFAVAGLGDE